MLGSRLLQMKIVQLITGSASFGGAEAHVRDLSIGLRARGHECTVMVGPPEGLLSDQLRASGVPVVMVPALRKPLHPGRDAVSLLQVITELRKIRPDILATHTAKAGYIGRIAARWLSVPSFFTPHGLSFIDRQTGRPIRFRLFLEQLAIILGGKMIAVCDAEYKLALKYMPMSEENISIIHNGLPDLELPHKQRSKATVITMVARFDRQKDHATLFRALSNLMHLDWELRLAGTGPILPSAIKLAEKYGLTPRVHFLHLCSEVPRLLSETDIFALITNSESFPISILEAMRSALPVIATDTGGVGEAVEDGVNGFLVPRCGVSLLSERLAALISSPEMRLRQGVESRLRFNQNFEWSSMLDKTEAIYKEAIPKPIVSRRASVTSA